MSENDASKRKNGSSLEDFILKLNVPQEILMPAKAGIQNYREKLDSRSPTKPFEDKFHGNDR